MILASATLDRAVKFVFWVSFCMFVVGPLVVVALFLLVMRFGLEWGEVETMQEAHVWFDEHHEDLIDLRDLMLELPEIRRLDPPADRYLAPGYDAIVPANQEKYELAAAMCNEMGILHLEMWRDRKTGKLGAVEFGLYSYGLSLGGLSIFVVFFPDPQEAADSLDDRWESYEPLRESGWYVVKSDTR